MTPCDRGANPPVDIVDMAKFTLSNTVMPHPHKHTAHTNVRKAYKDHSHFAVVPARGCTFSLDIPVRSTEKSCVPPCKLLGKRVIVKNTIPNPPVQWDKLRQKSRL